MPIKLKKVMKNIINEFLEQQDKILHFFASGWIFLILTHFLDSILVCFITTFLIGIAKEIYDDKCRNGADFYDVVANLLGIFVSMFICFVL